MIAFTAIAVTLSLLVLAAVLWPLRTASRGLFIGLLAAFGIAAILLYRVAGTPAAIGMPRAAVATTTPTTMDEAVRQLEAELKQRPDQPDGWLLLGRSYFSMQRYADAQRAYDSALKLQPDNPDLLVDLGEARMYANPQRLIDAESVKLLQRALELQPQHQRARWLLGVSQRQQGQPAEAAKTWEPLLAEVDASTAAALRPQLDAARKDAGLPPLPAAPAAAPGPAALRVAVKLDPDFAARVRLRGDATVFLVARAPDGPPMPVAAEKHSVSELPFTTTLDDSDSPMPTLKLSQLREVELVARLSDSGNAIPQEGDVVSAPVRVTLPAKDTVELVIGK